MSSTLPTNDCLPNEVVSRYILSKNHFRSTDHSVKHHAFEPPKHNKSLSVFRIQGLPEDHVWQLGFIHVATPQNRNLHARADVAVRVITRLNLRILPKEPPPRHANIIDWPDEKHLRISIAQQLAAESSLKIHPKT